MNWYEEQIEAARRRSEEQIEATRRSGASSLDLSGRMLGTVPESLAKLTALTELKLAGNELTVLPDWLGDLTALAISGAGIVGQSLSNARICGSYGSITDPRGGRW